MQIIETAAQLHFEGREISPRAWTIWGLLFLPGLLALLLLPEAYRFYGLLIWMAIWLASAYFLPRWAGDVVRVTLDTPTRVIIWQRNGRPFQQITFNEIKQFEALELATASRPYKTFRLVAQLKNARQITLAVDPNEARIHRALALARNRLRG